MYSNKVLIQKHTSASSLKSHCIAMCLYISSGESRRPWIHIYSCAHARARDSFGCSSLVRQEKNGVYIIAAGSVARFQRNYILSLSLELISSEKILFTEISSRW